MNCREWLETTPGLVARLAELICVNGMSIDVKAFGTVSATVGNRYGRVGLTMEEAFELTYYRGVYDLLIGRATPAERMHVQQVILSRVNGLQIQLCTESQLAAFIGQNEPVLQCLFDDKS